MAVWRSVVLCVGLLLFAGVNSLATSTHAPVDGHNTTARPQTGVALTDTCDSYQHKVCVPAGERGDWILPDSHFFYITDCPACTKPCIPDMAPGIVAPEGETVPHCHEVGELHCSTWDKKICMPAHMSLVDIRIPHMKLPTCGSCERPCVPTPLVKVVPAGLKLDECVTHPATDPTEGAQSMISNPAVTCTGLPANGTAPATIESCSCTNGESLQNTRPFDNAKDNDGCSLPASLEHVENIGVNMVKWGWQGGWTDNAKPVSSCGKHDQCYVTCGSNKSACDAAFKTDLLKKCAEIHDPTDRAECNKWADVFSAGVIQFGDGYFQDAQKSRCSCGNTSAPVPHSATQSPTLPPATHAPGTTLPPATHAPGVTLPPATHAPSQAPVTIATVAATEVPQATKPPLSTALPTITDAPVSSEVPSARPAPRIVVPEIDDVYVERGQAFNGKVKPFMLQSTIYTADQLGKNGEKIIEPEYLVNPTEKGSDIREAPVTLSSIPPLVIQKNPAVAKRGHARHIDSFEAEENTFNALAKEEAEEKSEHGVSLQSTAPTDASKNVQNIYEEKTA